MLVVVDANKLFSALINIIIISSNWITLSHSEESKTLNSPTASTGYTKYRDLKMPNLTLSIPEELKHNLDSLSEINWSESVRQFLAEKVKRALLLNKLDKLLENSKLTEEDCLRLGNEVKERVWKRYKAEGW